MLIKVLTITLSVLIVGLILVLLWLKLYKNRIKKLEIFLDALVEIQRGVLKSGAQTDFHQKIPEILGKASNACRVYIFRNSKDKKGNLLMTQISEWCDIEVSQQIDNPMLQYLPYYPLFARWVDILESGNVISGRVRDFPAGEKEVLGEQEIKCILIIPLIVKGDFYGFIGFDNTKNEREWKREEISLLQSSAVSISIDIERYISRVEKDQALLEANKANIELTNAYDEVKEINAKMEMVQKKLSSANDDLEKAIIEATGANKAKSQFLALMSHEIRTPLTSIIGYCELLIHDKRLNDEQKAYVNKIFNSGEGLLLLLNDLLELSAIEVGKIKINISKFEINKLINEIADSFRLSAGYKHIDFIVESSAADFVCSDRLRLGQILSNLLSNAIKFTREGGRIILGVKRKDNSFVFSVEDTGIGINEEDQDVIFDVFRQIDSPYKKGHTGSGVGLAICKKFVELLGGEIWLESFIGKGSTFYFRLPASTEGEYLVYSSEKKFSEKEAYDIECRILFAEDDISTFQLIENILSIKRGITYKGFSDGVYLCREFENNRNYDIILLDIQMGNMSGIDALNKIRMVDKDIPVIAMTAFAMESDEKKFLDLGFTSYMSKPISMDRFLEIIKKFSK